MLCNYTAELFPHTVLPWVMTPAPSSLVRDSLRCFYLHPVPLQRILMSSARWLSECNVCVCVCSCSRTVVLIFDGEAEDIASPEAGAVIHPAIEKRMGVGILNVQNLTSSCNMAGNALIGWDAKLFLHSHTSIHTHLLNCWYNRQTINIEASKSLSTIFMSFMFILVSQNVLCCHT